MLDAIDGMHNGEKCEELNFTQKLLTRGEGWVCNGLARVKHVESIPPFIKAGAT